MSAFNFREDVTAVVDGRVITGQAENGVGFGKTEDNVTMNVGASGEVLTNIQHNPTGQILIRLKANSPSISFLNRLANSNKQVSASVRRTGSLTEVASFSRGYVTRPAQSELGREAGDREFILMGEDYTQV